MTKEREALKLAFDVLVEINKLSIGENAICLPAEIDTAMDAAKEVLAQPEQEPPPECQTEAEKKAFAFGWFKAMEAQRKPLTDEQIMDITMNKPFDYCIGFARAIEAAHGIKGDA